MIEIRFHGRGGQGAAKACDMLAKAAFYEGKEVQAFPFFGVERRGAPVTAYTRISDAEIRSHCYIYEPDIVIVLDPTLMDAIKVTDGLKKGGKIIINTKRSPEEFKDKVPPDAKIYTVDATSIALKYNLGTPSAPIVNTAILGAVAKITGVSGIESVKKAIKETIPVKKEENAKAAEETFNITNP